MTDSVLLDKTYNFAVRIVKMYLFLIREKKEFVMSKQVLRSGTSIGANSVEAAATQSQRDFFHKCSIAYKEAKETEYWIKLLRDTGFISHKQAESMLFDLTEIIKILASSMITIRKQRKTKSNEKHGKQRNTSQNRQK